MSKKLRHERFISEYVIARASAPGQRPKGPSIVVEAEAVWNKIQETVDGR